MKVGSVCSGIEAASVAWAGLGFEFEWFSEIAEFPSRLLAAKYPSVPNEGDLLELPEKLSSRKIPGVDVICGGTPCQAFSLSGRKKGLADARGRLTLRFVDTVNANDVVRGESQPRTIVLWENVDGVLKDRTNAFGCFVAGLSGSEDPLEMKAWPSAGLVRGRVRNVAWRVLDAKHFGLPQQRKRLYVLAGGRNFNPENVLFENHVRPFAPQTEHPLRFKLNGHDMELFRAYTDCLYSAYGTKWNGNAAAYNGSLFVAQDGRLRRFTPRECERLMGFPDDYTRIANARNTNRYQGVGNSWAVPVVRWIGQRLLERRNLPPLELEEELSLCTRRREFADGVVLYDFSRELLPLRNGDVLNATERTEDSRDYDLRTCLETDADESLYISPVGCAGILRRKTERGIRMNPRLEEILTSIARQMPESEIERLSRRQRRGAFSQNFSQVVPSGCA